MKSRIMKITTRVAAAMAVASVIIGVTSVTARAEDDINECKYEETTTFELVPEAQCVDDLNKTEYISEDGYEPIIHTEMVSNAPVLIDEPEPEPEIKYNDGEIVRAEMVTDAPVIINELVPEEAPVIVDGPLLNKEMVSNAPVILDTAPEEPVVPAEQETVKVAEPEVIKEEPRRSGSHLPKTYEEIRHYGEIKQCYFDKGADVAFWTFIYYHPTPLGYEVIEHIEQEIREGNRGYTINGVYYDCPEHDPYFANDPYYANKRK